MPKTIANNKETIAQRNAKGFQKGRSGNPSGRPKKTQEELDLIDACKAKTADAMNTILQVMKLGQEKNRLSAAQFIIERGWGKAVQSIEMNANVTKHEATLDDLE